MCAITIRRVSIGIISLIIMFPMASCSQPKSGPSDDPGDSRIEGDLHPESAPESGSYEKAKIKTYHSAELIGSYVERAFYGNGAKKAETHVKDGKEQHSIKWHKDGVTKAFEGTYKAGKVFASTQWRSDGTRKLTTQYFDQKGYLNVQFRKNGRKSMESQKNGNQSRTTTFFPDETKKHELITKGKHRKEVGWRRDGTKKYEVISKGRFWTDKNGERRIKFKRFQKIDWWKNGTKRSETSYKNDSRELETGWDKDGVKLHQRKYYRHDDRYFFIESTFQRDGTANSTSCRYRWQRLNYGWRGPYPPPVKIDCRTYE